MSPLIAAPLLLTLTLLISGVSKIPARTETVDAMTSLRIPWRRLHPLAAIAVPIAEIVAAVLLWVPWVPLQVVAAVGVATLMAVYLVIIARALGFEDQVECSCFGTLASPTVSRSTLHRNITLTVLGVLGVVSAATGTTAQALTQTPLSLLGWLLALVVTLALVVFALGGVNGADARPTGDALRAGDTAEPQPVGDGEGEEELDYERFTIPYGALEKADGSLITLREMAQHRAALLLHLSQGCGPCVRVLDQVQQWRQQLDPLISVHCIFRQPHRELRPETFEKSGGEPLHDPDANVQRVFDVEGSPTAVLLGADGLTAGGPVIGGAQVQQFVEEIIEQIALARADGDLPSLPAPDDPAAAPR